MSGAVSGDRTAAGRVQPVLGSSWTHRIARRAVRPLIGTGVTPNHLTTARLLTGAAACVAFAVGGAGGNLWGGILWLVSAFVDRADGELARTGGMMSEAGHRYDYLVDNAVNSGFFLAIGIGAQHATLWHATLGALAMPLGVLAAASLALCNWASEALERRRGEGFRAYSGAWGFDPDDALYLMAPFAWAGLLPVVLVLAALGTTLMMAVTSVRLLLAAPRTRNADGA